MAFMGVLPSDASSGCSDEELDVRPKTSKRPLPTWQRGRRLTLAQRQAMAQFDSVDSGVTDRAAVFDTIGSARQRLDLKLEFFRERGELVLPSIESRFMCPYGGTGKAVVDIQKLRQLSLHEPCARPACSVVQQQAASVELQPAHVDACSSSLTIGMTPSGSMESLQVRKARLAEIGQLHDERIVSARLTGRRLETEKRLNQLEQLERKAGRKQIATRDRTMFSWVVTAIAVETLNRIWKSYRATCEAEAALQSDARQLRRAATILGVRSQRPLRRTSQALLLGALQQKWNREASQQRKQLAWSSWRHVLTIMTFMSRLLRRRRLNGVAERIKHFVNTTWCSFQLRASVKAFLRRVRMLQKAMRSALRVRRYVRKYIYHPMLWEAETRFLGKTLGIGDEVLKEDCDLHVKAWDLKSRLREFRQLVGERQHEAVRSIRRQDTRRLRRAGTTTLQPTITDMGQACGPLPRPKAHFSMSMIDRYRLSTELRREALLKVIKEADARWWVCYHAYKAQKLVFREQWDLWQLSVRALGPRNRQAWPPLPQIPAYPYVLAYVDSKRVQSAYVEVLKSSDAGMLLFP